MIGFIAYLIANPILLVVIPAMILALLFLAILRRLKKHLA